MKRFTSLIHVALCSFVTLTQVSVNAQTPDYYTCPSLETFSQNCLDFMVGHDDDAMCNDFESNMPSTDCIDQAEYILFIQTTAELEACEDDFINITDYYILERFKYECVTSMDGPCQLISEFNDNCVVVLDDGLNDYEMCTMEGAPDYCLSQSELLFAMDQSMINPCAGELTDYSNFQDFLTTCKNYEPQDEGCDFLEDFVYRCLGTDPMEDYCERYVWGLGDDDSGDNCEARATDILTWDTDTIHDCAIFMSSAKFTLLDSFVTTCAGYQETRPTNMPSVRESDGPCGQMMAFDSRCLEDAGDDYTSLCELYINTDYNTLDDDAQDCHNMAENAIDLSVVNFNYCVDYMSADAYGNVDSFRTQCESYSRPTPSPTLTPAPTLVGDSATCNFLEYYAGECLDGVFNYEDFCDSLEADTFDDDGLAFCASTADTVLTFPPYLFDDCESQMDESSWQMLDYMRFVCGTTSPAPTTTVLELDTCESLEDFSINCINQFSSTDDFDAMCADYETTQSDNCVEQAQYVIFILPQSDLAQCEDSMSDMIYNNLERFKYDCRTDFEGPCLWLSDFNTNCVSLLDDDLTEHQTCMLEGAPVSCQVEALNLYAMDSDLLVPCSNEVEDFAQLQTFYNLCNDYDFSSGACSYLEDFADDCLVDSEASGMEAYCNLYVAGLGGENDDNVEACRIKADNVLDFTSMQVADCAMSMTRSKFNEVNEFIDDCASYAISLQPTDTPDPCGILEAFENDCLDMTVDLATSCQFYMWTDVETIDNSAQKLCYNMAQTALTMSEEVFASCEGMMADDMYSNLGDLRAECDMFYRPSPAPSISPAPSSAAVSGCAFLQDYSERCLSTYERASMGLYCEVIELGADGFEDDDIQYCINTASVVFEVSNDVFTQCKSEMTVTEWDLLLYFREDCDGLAPSPTTAPDYESCFSIEDFGMNCLVLTDDDMFYEQYCPAMKTTMSSGCMSQAEYVLYFMPDSVLNNCRDTMNEEIFYNVQRFKYDCRSDFDGPCLWLSDFYDRCIDPLDMSTLSTHDTCMFEGVADSCETDAVQFYDLSPAYVIPCADDISDFDKFYDFVNLCGDYSIDDSTCLYLADFAEDCLGSTVAAIQDNCDLYIHHIGFDGDDTVEACALKANNVLEMSTDIFAYCADELSSGIYIQLDFFRNLCSSYVNNVPTPSPSEDTATAPCGLIMSFETNCLDLVDESNYNALCQTYIHENPDNLDDDEESQCYEMAQVVIDLNSEDLSYCSDIMDSVAYERVEAFKTDCEAFLPPTPSPTRTSQPTNGESVAPCEYLEEFIADCDSTITFYGVTEFCDAVKSDADLTDDSVQSCQAAAQSVVLDMTETQFAACEDEMSSSKWNYASNLRTVCASTHLPTEQPTEQPTMEPTPQPSLSPSLSPKSGSKSSSGSSSATAGATAAAVLVPLAALMAVGYWYYGKGGSTKSSSYGVEMTDYGDDGDTISLDFESGGKSGRRLDNRDGSSLDRPTTYSDEPTSRYTDKTPPRNSQRSSKYAEEEDEEQEGESGANSIIASRNPINFLDTTSGAEYSI